MMPWMAGVYQTIIKVVLALAALGLIYTVGYQHGKASVKVAVVEAQNAAVTRSVETAQGVRTDREEKRAERRSEASAQDKEVARAIQSNPEWADAPVPDSVWDSIFGPGASPAGGADRVPGAHASP